MGIYFIAAGSSSKNRQKSLDKGFSLDQLHPYLPREIISKLNSSLESNQLVYVWGANKRSLNQLDQVRYGEPVVDVKNKKVMQVFDFCFYYKASDSSLQEFIGWDSEKPPEKRRPYQYVFFLKSPKKSVHTKKEYFAEAFDQTHNQNWLVGQRYFTNEETDLALTRKNKESVEDLLGLSESITETPKKINKPTFKRKRKRETLPQKQFIIEDNQTGISYRKLFADYLKGAKNITLQDPYIRMHYQFNNLMEFCLMLGNNKSSEEVINLEVVTWNYKKYIDDTIKNLNEVKNSVQDLGINLSYRIEQHHDRFIDADNGWKITLGRGLDIFEKIEGRFNVAGLVQTNRKCKSCEITYLRRE